MLDLGFRPLVLAVLLVSSAIASAQTAPAAKPAAPAPAAPAVPATTSAPPEPPAAQPGPTRPARNDYAQANTWLCLPGQNGACDAAEDATVVAANGALTVEKFAPAKAPAIDCFYVYPTVSRDPGLVSTMNVAPEELRVVAQQFARFGQVCRTFAPLYRQFTLTALAARMAGKPMPAGGVDPHVGYNDVVDAWHYYLAHYNNGRGVVLIGHSQGSGVLTELIKAEIDGKPIQHQMISAILMGTRLQVPVGKDVGGDFASVPLCRAANQIHCAIAYASFRATAPPTATSLFGKSTGPGLEAACVNPAALAGGSGPVHAYFGTGAAIVGASPPLDWVKGKTIGTPFVSVPGLLTARCEKNDVSSYLAITVHGDPAGARTAEIPGDVIVRGTLMPDWGLHLIDANLFMGNLIDLVREQTAAYRREKH
jgi:hypothetical protein